MNPFKFFAAQLLVVLSWLCSLGSLTLTIVSGEQMLTVIQGWGPWELFNLEIVLDQGDE